ncbi:FAD-dependent oxidoreductase [Microcoleus sp. S28C3]|uniref:FAD-dependent oxidoreductase n=1 Tax=Microcoleus sp. S28C3 TaxID=3055414 RepID=UPI002FD2569D
MSDRHKPVVILGAGLQGCCVALELAQRGVRVVLLDRDEIPMNRASLRNEGKIHLGLVYANDRTLATANLVLQGSLHFYNLLAKWLGLAIDRLSCSTPFNYLVANDSLLTADELAKHYRAIELEYHQYLKRYPQLNYLGQRPEQLYRYLTSEELAIYFQSSYFRTGFQTAELAVDTEQLAILIRQAMERSSSIQFLPSKLVKSVERFNGLFRIEGIDPEGTWLLEGQQVINATWENRLAIDRSIGIECIDGWLHRLKYRVIARLPESLRDAPSVTMVIGRYGDVVIRPNGTVYLSWYPLALQGWSHELQPPASWDDPCRGRVPQKQARDLAAGVLEAIDSWFPGIGKSEPFLVDAGAIFAYGRTDVDKTTSGLHDRTKIGVTSVDGYHTVDTGKLTTAPLFAMTVADRVMDWML